MSTLRAAHKIQCYICKHTSEKSHLSESYDMSTGVYAPHKLQYWLSAVLQCQFSLTPDLQQLHFKEKGLVAMVQELSLGGKGWRLRLQLGIWP